MYWGFRRTADVAGSLSAVTWALAGAAVMEYLVGADWAKQTSPEHSAHIGREAGIIIVPRWRRMDSHSALLSYGDQDKSGTRRYLARANRGQTANFRQKGAGNSCQSPVCGRNPPQC